MFFTSRKLLILVMCIGFLAIQPARVSGLRSIDLVLRWSIEDHGPVLKNQHGRGLKAVETETKSTEKKPATANQPLDPYKPSKRRFRRGPDPIHNKC
ncbi:hypothetical protein NMG60_11009213 [Bertholletia excelsa]